MSRRSLLLIGSRLLQVLPVIILATVVIFGLLQLVPGDPAAVIAGENATAERIDSIRRMLGLDRPLWEQYAVWLAHALQGDLSTSLITGQPVADEVLRRLPNTLLITVLALLLAVLIGVPLGILAATRVDGPLDRCVTSLASLGVAVPNFWLAMLLVGTFALHFGWFPTTGAAPLAEDPMRALAHAALPAMALAAGGIAEITRQLRSALIEVLSSQYVRTLHAKGLSWGRILWLHGLKNVSLTLLTVIGLVFNRALGATVAIEAVFAIPGTGSLVVASATNKDFPVVQGVVFALVLIVIGLNLMIDLLYSLLDPRVNRR
ncbi:ABC transporter permease [Rhodovastum atsumiense]|uniref:ABC transporter permease n=1 Tax=Rhodovastum atsumiense TaxID=504468 RepID=A0A5M6IYN2_9PROT|nr:ABC transporter permease [Rhodovastum atsumiense]KAA5613453.1 ABC transporter permease [Rhodovastum atsumiense]CAH2603188.1 ABC transporter permease [Rhodovastum atsumiense]